MTHTAAPWNLIWREHGKSSYIDGKSENLNEPICTIPHDDITEEGEREMKANARLIASSPDLLEALENLWSVCDANQYEIPMGYKNQVFAAITKAKAA